MAVQSQDTEPVVVAGLAATYIAAVADGHSFSIAGGRVIAHVKNGSGGELTVTIKGGKKSSRYLVDRTVAIADGADKFIGFSNDDDYGGNDTAQISFSTITSVTFAVLDLT